MNTTNAVTSVSIKLAPVDRRCKYWVKIIRASQGMPTPDRANGANDLPQRFVPVSKDGRAVDEELFAGDFVIQGEELSHRRARGWSYSITWIDESGKARTVAPDSGTKADLKAQGIDPALLPGAGQLAACIRVAHALRAGLRVDGHGMAGFVSAQERAAA